jgi:hypothetical protein
MRSRLIFFLKDRKKTKLNQWKMDEKNPEPIRVNLTNLQPDIWDKNNPHKKGKENK